MKGSEAFCVLAKKIYTPYEEISDGFIIVEDGKIREVGLKHELKRRSLNVIDFENSIIVPGFIDLHVHGIGGYCTMEARPESIQKMRQALAAHGVTSFTPTLESAPIDVLKKSIEAIISVEKKDVFGAKVIGINLEGPFLNPEKAGAMKAEYLKPPNIEEFEELNRSSQNKVKLITVAPELPKGIEFIKYASSLGVTVSLGHSNATYMETIEAINAGASHVTHLFNAMRSFHHREPGIVGAVLENPNVKVELICDLVHLHPSVIKLVYNVKPIDSIVTVTDSIFADTPKGVQKVWEWKVIVKEDAAFLQDGTLAGSVLTQDRSLQNLVFKVGIPMKSALKTLTINPAKAINMDKGIGSIEEEKNADFVVLDKHLNVQKVFINGKQFK
jgi:N-acetylglucosamine-6-phosphate deacetylase